MKILSLEYEEFLDTPREWRLKEFKLKDINLIVGFNASGKTRTLNIIKSLSEYMYNPSKPPYLSGKWKMVFGNGKGKLFYEVEFRDRKVFYEKLKNKNELLLERDKDGRGKIKASQIDKGMLEFQISEDKLAISAKRDKLQHNFLEDLFEWGNNLIYFHFGSSMGQDRIKVLGEGMSTIDIRDDVDYIGKYISGIDKHREKYKNSIIDDMKIIDYDIRKVGLIPLKLLPPFPMDTNKVQSLQIEEEDIRILVDQQSMSQGMFRAFSLIIQLNYLIFSGIKGGSILIDDIGEGLDYDRSIKLIKLLVEKLEGTNNQLIMTTNDRFVMNNMLMKYWNILDRKGHIVEVINYENSKEIFNNFYKTGLSNFDFFSSKLYLSKEKNN